MGIQGTGLGLRTQHAQQIINENPDIPWFEVLIDNYFSRGGRFLSDLEKIAENYPMTFHSVGMNIAGTDPLDFQWLAKLKVLIQRFAPEWISDHLCWSRLSQYYHHDLLPFPYTNQNLQKVAERINKIQDFLEMEVAIENVSSYLEFHQSEMQEHDFMIQLCQQTGCKILLDINNIYVSASNAGSDPSQILRQFPESYILQFHLAGYELDEKSNLLIDTHSREVWPDVWGLFGEAVRLFGYKPTLIEWDQDIPNFEILFQQAKLADSKAKEVIGGFN